MMTLIAATVMIFAAPPTNASLVSREDLRKTLETLQSGFRDVEFVYEGRYRGLKSAKGRSLFFQGRFAYRNDSLSHLDIYTWSEKDPSKITEQIICPTKDQKLLTQKMHPGGGPATPPVSEPGDLISLYGATYPLYLYVYPRAFSFLKGATDETYECQGWEEIAGHKCLKVSIKKPSGEEKFWFDLERQGHVLRNDYIVGKDLYSQIVDVELGLFPDGSGKKFWFPIRSRGLHYRVDPSKKSPDSEENHAVVSDTLFINRKLPDSRFTLAYRPGSPASPSILRDAVAKAAEERKTEAAQSLDERLASTLKKAEAQSQELQASAPSRRSWLATNAATLALISAAGGFMALAWILKRRSS